MGWLPHLMILDDDPRVLESLVPSVIDDLARGLAKSKDAWAALRRGDPGGGSAVHIKVSAHGYDSKRLADYRYRTPHHAHLHLVRERGGRFDLARRLLNEQLFAVVVSDLRFSDDAGGQRAGQLLVDEATRVHPELEGLLYSAYPRPEEFPPEARGDVLARYPRHGFGAEFTACFEDQAERKPGSTAAASLANDGARRIAANPLESYE